VVQDE